MSMHLQQEVERLKKKILALAAKVESVIIRSVKAVEARDAALARAVVDGDAEIDRDEVEIEEDCLKLLALYQPVATDLRFIVMVMKINNDLERIGDLAVNIAERAAFLAGQPPIEAPYDFATMRAKAIGMLRESLDALMQRDAKRARGVRTLDDEVDALNREMYAKVGAAVRRNPDQIDRLLSYLGVSRHLERVGDYATNIAEDVIYLVEGVIVRHVHDEEKS